MFLLPSSKETYLKLEGFDQPAASARELPEDVVVRHAVAGDEARVSVLARLDDQRRPVGPFLVAELGGEVVAARSLSSGAVVADPFRRTLEATELLAMRATQIAERSRADAARAERAAAVAAAAATA